MPAHPAVLYRTDAVDVCRGEEAIPRCCSTPRSISGGPSKENNGLTLSTQKAHYQCPLAGDACMLVRVSWCRQIQTCCRTSVLASTGQPVVVREHDGRGILDRGCSHPYLGGPHARVVVEHSARGSHVGLQERVKHTRIVAAIGEPRIYAIAETAEKTLRRWSLKDLLDQVFKDPDTLADRQMTHK